MTASEKQDSVMAIGQETLENVFGCTPMTVLCVLSFKGQKR